MKVKELIEILSKFDPESKVVIDGYEGGVTEQLSVHARQIISNFNTSWYYGEHELFDSYYLENNYLPDEEVAYIARYKSGD